MKFLKWLLHAGRPNRQAVGQAGHANVADTVWAQTNEIGLVQRDIRYRFQVGTGELLLFTRRRLNPHSVSADPRTVISCSRAMRQAR